MFEVSMFIPLHDNDGKCFTKSHHDAFEAFVLERLGGLTRGVRLEGLWSDGEQLYEDKHQVYTFALSSISEGDKIGEVAAFAKRHYRQEAMYIRYLGLAEIL